MAPPPEPSGSPTVSPSKGKQRESLLRDRSISIPPAPPPRTKTPLFYGDDSPPVGGTPVHSTGLVEHEDSESMDVDTSDIYRDDQSLYDFPEDFDC